MTLMYSESRVKERAAPGANIRDGNGIETCRNKVMKRSELIQLKCPSKRAQGAARSGEIITF